MRLFRVSFTGEVGFEINVPSGRMRAVWDRIWQEGKPHGLTPYGTEAMHVLRAEKGYLIVGQETDGTMTPGDVGCGWAVSKVKPDFIGKRALALPALNGLDRLQMVGLLTEDPQTVLEEGMQLVRAPEAPAPVSADGHVTSSYYSPALGRSIAIAMVKGGRDRMGETLYAPAIDGSAVKVSIVNPVFYDPEGVRVNG
jgi:sarcosine oxidase subunit alpha